MGKMRLGSTGQQQASAPIQPALPQVSQEEFDKAIKDVMEKHANTFKRLAEAEEREKQKPMLPPLEKSCMCSPAPESKPMLDRRARKHTVAVRKQLEDDHKELDGLLAMYAKSNDQKMIDIRQQMVTIHGRIEDVIELIPEENQVVKEIIIEKSVTDPKVWLAIGAAVLLNIAFLLLK